MLDNIFSHATIIVNGDYESFKKELSNKNILYLSFDVEDKNEKDSVKNFKIEDLKKIKEFQNSKVSEKRFVATDRSFRSTVIQNAFLKLLEEPNPNIYIVLFTKNLSMFLPTVLSRSQIIKVEDADKNKVVKDKIKNLKLKNRFDKLERFLIAEDYNKRGLITDKQIEDYKALI
ncbi:MAG: hypothetical protein QG614_196 [Patescibacteria group bacterium]|nr:hypothetical protein [Patescibacteria group bacterium]